MNISNHQKKIKFFSASSCTSQWVFLFCVAMIWTWSKSLGILLRSFKISSAVRSVASPSSLLCPPQCCIFWSCHRLSLLPMAVQRCELVHILFHSKNKDEIQEDMTRVPMSRSMSIVHMHVATLSESPSTFPLFQYQSPLTLKWQNSVFSY